MMVVKESRILRDGTFGGLAALFILAFVRGYPATRTTGGLVGICIFVGLALAAIVCGWIMAIRRPTHLEVSEQAITLVGPKGERSTLSRSWGDELAVVATGRGRYPSRGLTIAGSGTVLSLRSFFSLKKVRKQCTAHGWTFSGRQIILG